MNARNRRDRIDELFSAVYQLPHAERRARLQATDDADRAEVEALIETHDALTRGDDDFLQALDTDSARSLLEQSGPAMEAPPTIGRYRVVRRLARGGMGIVYLAHDPRLDRPVAIKLLPPFLSADPAAVRGLAEEARTASALDDPRIETVYEIGETDEGNVFIAMAYYDGETLRERIRRGPMEVSEVVELGIQLAEGIHAAHRAGVIHRDIKPENVLITSGGALKIVDFGIAKVVREDLTTAGLLPGTAAYMSPEQTRGEGLDGRSDVWSTGVVLYEMLVGERPFQGAGDALVHAIRHDPPPDLASFRPDLPVRLPSCVERCLDKERDRRFPSAGALAAELREAGLGELSTSVSAAPHPRRSARRVPLVIGAASLAVVILAILLGRRSPDAGPAAAGSLAPAIAVLPFEVRGEDLGLWREGMVDLLSIGLGGATDLRVIDARTVLANWREAVGEGVEPDLAGALQVARGTGARYAVVGSVVSVAQGLRVGARIYSLPERGELASLQARGSPDSLFSLVDRLAIDILSATWQGEEQPRRQVDLTRATTSSLPALKAYLEGESLLRRTDFGGAAAAYERAVAEDSTFAFALFHLGLAYGWLGDADRQDGSYARALRHAGRLPEREVLLLRAISASPAADLATTIGMLDDVTRRYPDDADAWYFLGDRYFHDGEQVLASRAESERAFRRVVELDPGFAPAYIHLIDNAFTYRPDSARADSLRQVYRSLAPASAFHEEHRIAFGLAFGDSARRSEAFADLDILPPVDRRVAAERHLDHPRFWDTRGAVLDRLRRHPTPDRLHNHLTMMGLADNAMSRGRLAAAAAYLEDPLMFPGYRRAGFYRMYSADLPLPRSTLDRVLAFPGPDDRSDDLQTVLSWFYAGAYAADQERREDHALAVNSLSAEADRLLSAGDSAGARFVRGAATALRGKGLWVGGDPDRALPLLLEGQRAATWPASPSRAALNESIRWWIGELLLGSGRPRDAAIYFESFWDDPLAGERLGPIYERIGDPVRARAAYALVTLAWRDADPELRSRARAAEAAMQRLSGAGPR